VTRHAEHPQEAVEHRRRIGRRLCRAGVEAAEIDEQHPVEPLVPDQQMAGVHGELGLADAGHPGDGRDHHRAAGLPGTLQRAAQPVQLVRAAGEPVQVLRQRVLHADLRPGVDLGVDRPQRLPPSIHVVPVRVQRLDDGHDEVGVQPPPPGPEAVGHGGSAGQLACRPARRGPGRVHPVLDRVV